MGAIREGGKSPTTHSVVTPGMTLPLGNDDGEADPTAIMVNISDTVATFPRRIGCVV
jgi:hypothetical protein